MHILGNVLKMLQPLGFLAFLLLIGVSGYEILEDWDWVDSLYMTVITISTVGFGEAHPLSRPGKIFTVFLIMGGVIFYGLAIEMILRAFIGRRFISLVEEARVRDRVKKLKNHIIVCGGGRMAVALIKELEREKQPFVVLETNPESSVSQLKKLEHTTWLIMERDALLEESLLEVNIESAIGLAAVLPTDADNLFLVLSARRLNPRIRIETRIAKESTREKMLQAGADKVISPYSVGGLQMARSILRPDVDDFLELVLDRNNYEFPIKVHTIDKEDELDGKTLLESPFRQEGFIAIGVKMPDGQLLFAPSSEFTLRSGMEVLLLGSGTQAPLD